MAAADWPRGIAGQGEQRGAPSPWLGAGLGTDGPWVELSGDLPGSSQPLNLSFSKIFRDPWSIPLLGVGGIMPEAADALHGLKALGILAPILHPPHARTWKMTQTQGSGGVVVSPPRRASPALWGYKHPCRFPIVVSCSSASPGTVSARPVATASCSMGF